MNKYLVDTTVLIDHLRGNKKATKFLKQNKIIVSYVSVAELMQGSRNKKDIQMINSFVRALEVDWGLEGVNRLALDILGKYRLKYGVHFLDALIAATAILGNYILVTANIKYFKNIPNLKITSQNKFVARTRWETIWT